MKVNTIGVASAIICFLLLTAFMSLGGLRANEQKQVKMYPHSEIFVYSEQLDRGDSLQVHGKNTKPISIKSSTRLVWVDREPNARFAHSTEFILISETGTQVVNGSWWPILNGKDLFRDRKSARIEFPLELPSKTLAELGAETTR